MHAPAWVCERLAELHPQARLAWAGRRRKTPDELNPGEFALIQLYHVRDCGSPDEPTSFREFWDFEPVPKQTGDLEMRRIERGPVFNKHGGLAPDWDTNKRRPIFVTRFDSGLGFTHRDIFSGRFLEAVRRWTIPIGRRIRESAREKARRIKSTADSMGQEMSNELWREAQKPTSESVIMANKFTKADMADFEARKVAVDRALNFESKTKMADE